MKHLVFLGLILASLSSVMGQSVDYLGPLINFNKPIRVSKRLNSKNNVELRQRMLEINEQERNQNNSQQRISLQSIIQSNEVSDFNLGLGVMYRLNYKDNNQFRFIQQISYINASRRFKMGHRFRLDQTFKQESKETYRARYRFATQLALKGVNLNPQEYYLKLSSELLAIYANDYATEYRQVAMLGKKLKSNTKIELGLDYRMAYSDHTQNTYWLSLQLYLP